jgi:hypothetical protein
MAVTWDYSVLPFQSVEFSRRNLSRSGGLTIFGTEQVVQSSSDFWAANVTLKVRKREQILAYRMDDSGIRGGVHNDPWVPEPGVYFSIGSRLYLIATVSKAGNIYTATFVPKLRTTANVNAPIEFSQPKCLMRLAQDNIGQMNLDMLKFSDVSLSFVEVPA